MLKLLSSMYDKKSCVLCAFTKTLLQQFDPLDLDHIYLKK